MVTRSEKVGILFSPHPRPGVKKKVEDAFRLIPKTSYVVFHSLEELRNNPTETIVTVGGDGTNKQAAERVMASDSNHTLVTTDAGTANMVHNSLRHAGQTVSVEELMDGHIPSTTRPIYPGEVDGDVFLMAAGFGLERRHPRFVKALTVEHRPTRLARPYVAAIENLKQALVYGTKATEGLPIGDVILTGSHIGRNLLKPTLDEGIFGTILERATVEGSSREAIIKGALAWFIYIATMKFPPGLVKIERGETFTVQHGIIANLDGEEKEFAQRGEVEVTRSKKPLTMLAFKK